MKILKTIILLLPVAFLLGCGDDEDDTKVNDTKNNDISVVISEDGKTSNSSHFSSVDDKNFYLDYIKYTVKEGHLVVSGYDKTGFSGNAKIVSKITYKGNLYEVLEIGDFAFFGCNSLTSISIPKSVTNIGNLAFAECFGLTSFTIGNGVTSIMGNAFAGCAYLTSINVDSSNLKYDSRDNCNAIIETASNTLIIGCKNTTIPNSVTSIGYCAFEESTLLTSITVPENVTSIGDYAFSGCSSLTSVTMYNTTPITIHENTFSNRTILR